MMGPRPFILLMVAVGSMEVAGCGGEAARSAQTPHASTNSRQASLAARHARSSNHDAPHEGFLSTYHNPEEGISFRYPRNYSLEEGDVQERSFFLKKQEGLDNEQPGATLVATVLIPEDGYPNTTFEHGSVQLVINEAGTEKSCRDASVLTSSGNVPRTLTARGVGFRWSEEGSETGGTKVLERVCGICARNMLRILSYRGRGRRARSRWIQKAGGHRQDHEATGENCFERANFHEERDTTGGGHPRGGGSLVITTRGEQATLCRRKADSEK